MTDENKARTGRSPEVQQQLAGLRRLLKGIGDIAREASMTGALRQGQRSCVQQYNRVLEHLERLGAIEPGVFPPLAEDVHLDDVGVVTTLLSEFLDAGDDESADEGVRQIQQMRRLLNGLANIARDASMCGALRQGSRSAAAQYGRILRYMEQSGAVQPGFFSPLPDDPGIDEIGVAATLLRDYLGDDDNGEVFQFRFKKGTGPFTILSSGPGSIFATTGTGDKGFTQVFSGGAEANAAATAGQVSRLADLAAQLQDLALRLSNQELDIEERARLARETARLSQEQAQLLRSEAAPSVG